MTNPATPPFHLIGAFSLEIARLIADTLAGMEAERSFVVHGAEGWDEPTPIGPFTVFDVRPGKVDMQVRVPADYGLQICKPADLAGGDAHQNARALAAVLNGQDRGAHRDCLLLGTALASRWLGGSAHRTKGCRQRPGAQCPAVAAGVLQAGPGRLQCGLMSDFLEQMAVGSRERLEAARRGCSEAELLQRALALPPAPRLVADPAHFDLIAELKLRSPAVGQLKSGDEDVAGRVTAYARAGAAAVSVLTEPSRFDGSMAHLQTATKSLAPLNVPVMRKDFLIDPYQVIEARAAGAGGVLVIIRMLSRSGIAEMLECARNLGLFVLLEAFDEADIDVMQDILATAAAVSPATGGRGVAGPTAAAQPAAGLTAAAPVLAGLNCRDLATLQIVPSRLIELADRLPTHVPRVAESGVVSAQDAARVAGAGYELALVGSALMQGGDPHTLAAAMLEAGRQSARRGK